MVCGQPNTGSNHVMLVISKTKIRLVDILMLPTRISIFFKSTM
jgi:hypothetical protein